MVEDGDRASHGSGNGDPCIRPAPLKFELTNQR